MLAAVRCLDGDGFEVTGVGTTRTAPGLWSRAVEDRRLAPDPRQDAEGFIEKLEEIVRATRHDVLIPGTDAALLAVSQHRDRLAPHVRLGLPDKAVVERALDRDCLASEASRVGLAPPEAQTCMTVQDALVAAESFGYPVLVKPVHTVVEQNGAFHRSASVLARDGSALESAARRFGSCIVQRQAQGNVISFGGVATGSGLIGCVVSRYKRTWPPEAGNVCFSETIASPAGLVESVQELVAGIGWEGMFELELIQSPDGTVAAIDFNPRAYGSMSLAVAAGVPLPALWCRWLLGEELNRHDARVGVRYRWEDADLRHFAWKLRKSDLASALDVIKPRSEVTHAYLTARDPGPVIARAVQLVQRTPGRRKELRRIS